MKRIFFITAAFMLLSLQYAISGNPENKSENESNMVTVTGQVLDLHTGEALAGVLVKVGKSDSKVYTDLEGRFGISNLTPGNYNITASLISYKKSEIEVEVNGEDKETFSIQLNQEGVK